MMVTRMLHTKRMGCFAIWGTALAALLAQTSVETERPNGRHQRPAFPGQTRIAEQKLEVPFELVTVAEGLSTPWALAFLPDGRMLITERPGRLRLVTPEGHVSMPLPGLPAVDARGQGGLLGLALDPKFAANQLIYWSYSERRQDGNNHTAVARGRLALDGVPSVQNVQVIFRQSPSLDSTLHFGSRLVFARDGTLFVTTGDRSITEGRMQARRLDGLLGKVVRINPDGSVPPDNPYVPYVGKKILPQDLVLRSPQHSRRDAAPGDRRALDD